VQVNHFIWQMMAHILLVLHHASCLVTAQCQNTCLTVLLLLLLLLLPAALLGRRSQAQHGEVTLAETLAKSSKASSELAALRTENQSLMQVR
jgi:hypothetical protein